MLPHWDKVCSFEILSYMYLKHFGDSELLESSFVDAESYLIKVIQSNSTSTTFDELRCELYCKTKQKNLYDLPFTLQPLQGHLERCY